MSRPVRRRLRAIAALVAAMVLVLGSLPVGGNSGLEFDPAEQQVIQVIAGDEAGLDRLIAMGIDLTEHVEATEDGLVVHAVLTGDEISRVRAQGFATGEVISSESDSERILAERDAELAAERAAADRDMAELQQQAAALTTDVVKILRADFYTSFDELVISVEARTSAGDDPSVDLEMCWDSGPGTDFTPANCEDMSRFSDVGHYLYHRDTNDSPDVRPSRVRVTSSEGGSAIADVTDWLPTEPGSPRQDPYLTDFITDYMSPTELYAAYDELAAQFPDLVEVIELPYLTNGYRRHAQALMGSTQSNAVVVTSTAWGHEGGNDLTIAFVDPGAADSPLSVSVTGNDIVVSLGTDAGGALVSTAAEVVAALDAHPSGVVDAFTYRGNAGAGIAQPQAAEQLSDFLDAPAEISRDPFQVKAYRIGKHRDGSKVGVLAYAQEHAREWVPPLVALETANRLLHNYGQDGETKQLLNNLDIFFLPSVNPDGGHFSFFDENFQRRNLTNHCDDANSDPARRDDWGVDVNRNYNVGSLFDGYFGASDFCRSDVFAGPAELSEPESSNVAWLADTFPNIRFSMNLHSSGNYFMWSPGSYILDGRVTLPRPTVGEEAFFWASSNRILTEIKKYRGLSVTPARTGPIADVLYSAAGNSGDRLWYENGIYAWNFEVGFSFQPSWDEAHAETMEFANGLMELMRVAYDFGKDTKRPDTTAVFTPGDESGTVDVDFDRTEPVTIFYELDGSRPTFDSDQLVSAGIRELDETLTVAEGSMVHWFSIDAAGNIENNYNPDGSGNNYNKAVASAG
ncbi:MAG: M14 family zinc carboxypeptidase [Candidatus Limnocylindria bacterium]